MKKYNIILIVLSLLFYLINKLNRLFGFVIFDNAYINNHLNDILASSVILGFSNILLENKYHMIENLLSIEIFVLVCGLFWEFITPLYKADSVSDFLDLIAYCFGGLVYWIVMKLIKKKEN